jgi:plasmid maintenance system antidote protein VapI
VQPFTDAAGADAGATNQVSRRPLAAEQLTLQPAPETFGHGNSFLPRMSMLDGLTILCYNRSMTENNHLYSGIKLNRIIDAQGRRRAWLAAQLGITVRYIHYICRGERTLTPDLAERAAALLGVPSSLFLAVELRERSDCFSSGEAA